MLGKDDILKVFDAKDKRISEMSHVKSIFTDENKFAFVIREKDGQNEVFSFWMDMKNYCSRQVHKLKGLICLLHKSI